MPVYDYECEICGTREEFVCGMDERPKRIKCPSCKKRAMRQVISNGHGGIQCDSAADVPWLKSAEDVIKRPYEKPWETRTDYKNYLKENGLEPGR